MFPFSLNDIIGSSYPADPDDVLRTKKGLNCLGFYSAPKEYGMTPWTDNGLFDGLKNFQRENGLAVDGIMKPGGPTQSLLGRRLSGRKDERDLMPKTFAPLSGLGKGEKNREEDVLGLRRGLAGLGLMPRGEAVSGKTLFDEVLERAVKTLQGKHGLKEDGIIRPKGPTQEVFDRLLGKHGKESPAKPHVLSTIATEKTRDRQEPAANLLQLAQAVKDEAGDTELDQKPAPQIPPKLEEKKNADAEENPPPTIMNPTGGIERNDPDGIGKGRFGASRDGGERTHQGTDIKAQPGQHVLAPIDGAIKRRNIVYDPGKYPERKDLKLVEIEGSGRYKGMKVKILYVGEDGPKVGEKVQAGKSSLGSAQEIRKTHGNKMTPHVHMEVEWNNVRIDPANVLQGWASGKPTN